MVVIYFHSLLKFLTKIIRFKKKIKINLSLLNNPNFQNINCKKDYDI